MKRWQFRDLLNFLSRDSLSSCYRLIVLATVDLTPQSGPSQVGGRREQHANAICARAAKLPAIATNTRG
jgi:hypothetical protein